MKTDARWIASPVDTGKAPVVFCKEFSCAASLRRAWLAVSGLGLYVVHLNGVRLGNDVFDPGYTAYEHRTQMKKTDVTALLREKNHLEITVGAGWALDFRNKEHYYVKQLCAIAELETVAFDGTRTKLLTDSTWTVKTSPILYSELYHGETVDQTAPIRVLGNAVPIKVNTGLVRQIGAPIREQERIAPIALIKTPKGEAVLDFGQNLTGYVELRTHAPKGTRIVLHHAEVLDRDGSFYSENMRAARNECIYITDGKERIFKPTFSFQGFRYVRLTEYPSHAVDLHDFCAIAVHSQMERTGEFLCGNEKINQLYHNVIWGQKSNYLDIPTDCPQRDERLGWTGDAQLFCRTAAINFDVERFFEKWLGDMKAEQAEDGSMPFAVPRVHTDDYASSAAWADASVIIPWELYMAYGNRAMLERYFPMMKKWVDYMHASGPEEFLFIDHWHFGDWLALDAGEDSYAGATPKDLIASAFYAHSTSLLIRAGEALGKDMSFYRKLHQNILTAFRTYFLPNGRLLLRPDLGRAGVTNPPEETQTAYALILHFGLCEERDRKPLADALASLIRKNNGLMSTGLVGTPYLLHALSDNGYATLAYRLLFEERIPSWLYSVNRGATTIWEHWNGIKEDGSFWSSRMNSFNHYVMGSVYDWIFGNTVGIRPIEPAYRKVLISPLPDARFGFVRASIRTRCGKISVHWYYKGEKVYYELDIPDGIEAHLRLPSGREQMLGGGRYLLAE